MPILPTTPTAKTFANAWATEFEKAVKTAAGKDQRLSVTEARRISERSGGPQLFSDNAVNYLLGKGQQTVSVSVLVNAARSYAEAKGAAVAGADGKISLADGAKLPTDLRDDFMYLRGKLVAGPPERTPTALKADVDDLARYALDNKKAVKLAGPPASVRGRDPIVERIEHPASKTAVAVWVAEGRVYLQRSSQAGTTGLVGWWDAGPVPPQNTGRAALRASIDAATKGLWSISDRDAKVTFVRVEGAPGHPTADGFKTLFGAAHDQLVQSIYDTQNWPAAPLAGRDVTVGDAHDFLDRRANNFDPADPASVANAQKWSALKSQLEGQLTDLKLYRAGGVEVSYFVIGKTRNGDLAGVLTAAIET